MRLRLLGSLLFLGFLVGLSGCATVAHGRFQQIPVVSNPPGAAVEVDCGHGPVVAGETPVVVKVQRKAEYCALTLSRDGYRPATITLGRSWSGWVWGNLLLDDAFLVGAAIDLADGAFYKRTPGKVHVTLKTDEAAAR